jgi:hypothetical protein
MRLTIKNCAECPFANHDNEYGTDACNINDKIVMQKFQELPNDKVHEECPLLKNDITIGIRK